ncbi:hypothetical protein HanPI659440_Chr09g0344511 [Helianthus annuus]|nr:hypothetical protein HanPI659440_Chr09g0344511 [Helianthus annuus]
MLSNTPITSPVSGLLEVTLKVISPFPAAVFFMFSLSSSSSSPLPPAGRATALS